MPTMSCYFLDGAHFSTKWTVSPLAAAGLVCQCLRWPANQKPKSLTQRTKSAFCACVASMKY